MALAQSDLTALVSAWATGVLRVTYDGKMTEFRSKSDLEKTIARIAAALGVANPLLPSSPTQRPIARPTVFARR